MEVDREGRAETLTMLDDSGIGRFPCRFSCREAAASVRPFGLPAEARSHTLQSYRGPPDPAQSFTVGGANPGAVPEKSRYRKAIPQLIGKAPKGIFSIINQKSKTRPHSMDNLQVNLPSKPQASNRWQLRSPFGPSQKNLP